MSALLGAVPAATAFSHSTLSSLQLLAALDDRQSGILIFDNQLRLVHLTTQAWRLLGLREEDQGRVSLLPELLALSSLDEPSVLLAKSRIAQFWEGCEADSFLLQAKDNPGEIVVRLRSIGDGVCAAKFERPTRNDAPASSENRFEIQDGLTGIASRRCFESALEKALERTPPEPAAVLLIDLDRFKAVNDTLGHAAGDTLLCLVAQRLQSAVRKGDVVARFGGDEFAVLLEPARTREEVAAIAKRILDLAQRTYLIEGQLVNVGASIGVSWAPCDGNEAKVLLQNADLALYHSKASGRASFHFFDPMMQQRALARRTSELELRRALALKQLEVHYQPQVDTAASRLVGFEALIRWRHPERGLVPPGEFLPLAEEIGAIIPIGNWVLRTACREAMKWPAGVVVAVNASPQQIEAGHFANSVRKALAATGLPGERLEIEITEGTLLSNSDVVLKTLADIRAMNVRIAMDDFGTGYASLSQLARFPFDKIKIDRSLAGFEGEDYKKRAIVRAITTLGESLGVRTLAEGIENADQVTRLQMDGCSSVQGYFFGRPVPPGELADVISRLCPASPTSNTERKHEN